MCKLKKTNESDGKCSVKNKKSIDPHDTRPDASCEDLLDGPLPAG